MYLSYGLHRSQGEGEFVGGFSRTSSDPSMEWRSLPSNLSSGMAGHEGGSQHPNSGVHGDGDRGEVEMQPSSGIQERAANEVMTGGTAGSSPLRSHGRDPLIGKGDERSVLL